MVCVVMETVSVVWFVFGGRGEAPVQLQQDCGDASDDRGRAGGGGPEEPPGQHAEGAHPPPPPHARTAGGRARHRLLPVAET